MRQFNKLKDTKGFITIWERVIRFRYMITEQAKERCRILAFWEKYGYLATKEAFKVSRPTLFRWQKKLKENKGQLEGLNKKSTAPKNKRKRIIPKAVIDFIVEERKFDSHLSKDKLSILMLEDGIGKYSPSTVGRMLNDLKKEGKLLKTTKLSYHAKTNSFHERTKIKRKKIRSKGHIGGLVKADSIIHFHTYPRCPKQNSEIERFNRTLSDAFISRNLHLLVYDIDAFNQKLIDWLLWYNTRRPHWSLGLISPLRYIVSTLTAKESQMCWTSTKN